MTMAQRGIAVKTRVRKFKINDLDQVVAIAERYASWDVTATKADIEGFHSASPEFFFVDEDYRRQGIATSLLTALFEEFKQKEIDLVTLSVPTVEVAAMKLYGKLGFEPRAQFLWKRLSA